MNKQNTSSTPTRPGLSEARTRAHLRRIEQGTAARLSAYVILSPAGRYVGKVWIEHRRNGGGLRVFVWDWTDAEASHLLADEVGTGNLCETDALAGLTFGGVAFLPFSGQNGADWREQLRARGFDVWGVL